MAVVQQLKQGNITRESESLLIAAQNKAIYQSKNRQGAKNSWCRLFGDWNETINIIISQYSKLVQKDYKIDTLG